MDLTFGDTEINEETSWLLNMILQLILLLGVANTRIITCLHSRFRFFQGCKNKLSFLTPNIATKNLPHTFCHISRDYLV